MIARWLQYRRAVDDKRRYATSLGTRVDQLATALLSRYLPPLNPLPPVPPLSEYAIGRIPTAQAEGRYGLSEEAADVF